MEKELVTFEQALALQELGFDEECIFVNVIENGKFAGIYTPTDYNDFPEQIELEINVPLKQQVFRWFREKYNIQGYIYSSTVRGNKEGTKQFTGYVWNINGIDMPFISTDAIDELHDTYEEAENDCIDKLIEIAKKQDISQGEYDNIQAGNEILK
jgi:hypothetical protein